MEYDYRLLLKKWMLYVMQTEDVSPSQHFNMQATTWNDNTEPYDPMELTFEDAKELIRLENEL